MSIHQTRWFWLSILSVTGWGAWALLLKLGSRGLSAEMTQFFATLGMLPAALAILLWRKFKLESSFKGASTSVVAGAISSGGILALVAAFKAGGKTDIVVTATALYPLVTVLLAVLILHERLTKRQIAGAVLATLAIVIFTQGGA